MGTRLLLSFFLLLATLAIHAVPAKPITKKVQLQDGTIIELTLCGDEHFSYMTDANGNPYLIKNKGLVERTTQGHVAELWAAQREKRFSKAPTPNANSKRASHRVGTSGATIGKHRGLVILMQFTDVPFVTENPQAVFNRFFNEPDYNEYGMIGSVKDYFYAQSYGQLEVDFDVVGPFTAANEMAYYGAHDGDDNDIRPAWLISEAVDAASEVVDFSNYDWDGDGEVDQVFVIYAGYAEAQGADENTIWPHEWVIEAGTGSKKNYQGLIINTYGCAAELRGDGKTNTGLLDGIGTACHEFSHCLGLPDMYDTKGNNYAMATWDVMCSGSYNGNSNIPSAYTSYERWFSGWMEPTEINTMTRITDMKPLTEKAEAYVLYNDKNKNEFYLLENRQQTGFDQAQYGHGLLILHVDYNSNSWETNTVNASASHQCMTIIPADNDYQFSIKGIAGDTWPGTSGNTSLTNYTEPAATLYNANTDGTKLISKPIDNISEDNENMTISFVACRPEIPKPEPGEATGEIGEKSFTVTWPTVSGAVGYEIELTTIDKASTDPTEALQHEFDFSKCYSEKTGYTDISSKLSDYGLSGWSGSKLFTTPNKLRLGTTSSVGNLKSPTWKVPSSYDLTIVMGADVVSAATSGTIKITYGNEGESVSDAQKQSVDFEVTKNSKQVFVFKDARKELFFMEIAPNAQMYMNYLAVYDGEWTAEQLGINNASSRRASTVAYYTSGINSYTFADLDVNKRFIYRIRTIGEENTYSQWSDEKSFEFGTSGILPIRLVPESSRTDYFDLQGREVNGTQKGVLIRRQGSEVKKVMVK